MIVLRDPSRPILNLDYEISKRRTFEGTTYCQGRLIYVDGADKEVTFVFYKDRGSAEAFYNCADENSHHHTTFRSWSYSDEVRDKEPLYVVSFDPFLRFFTEGLKPEDFTTPDTNIPQIPGIPPAWVQNLILNLIDAIEHLQAHGFSCRLLHLPKSFVWCKGGELKLFRVDKKMENFDPQMWLCSLEVDISRFKVLLKDYILVGTQRVSSPQRDAFFRGFDPAYNSKGSYISPAVRLKMIKSDHFLKNWRSDMFEQLAVLDRGLHNDVKELENYNIEDIYIALSEEDLFNKVCPTGDWGMNAGPVFRAYLIKRLGPGPGPNHMYSSLISLIRYLINPYQHGAVSVDDLYDEVNTLCPKVFSIVHQVKWHYVRVPY